MAATRVQRWAIALTGYSYTIRYKPTAPHGNVDGLSRLPQTVDHDQVVSLQNSVWAVQASLDKLPVTAKDIQKATRNDPELSKVLRYITTGWGSSAGNDELKPFSTINKSSPQNRVVSIGVSG